MTKSFREKWLEEVEKKKSVLCAGLDPAEYGLGRKNQSLPDLTDKREWSFRFVEAVAPYAAALKINANYWKNRDDMTTIADLAAYAQSEGMAVIDDSKLADISSSNEAGIYYSAENNFDAVTLAPFAGNMKEAAEHAREWGIGLFSVCLMSNSEYRVEKNSWEEVSFDEGYNPKDIAFVYGTAHVRKYIKLANESKRCRLDGIIIGAPSKENHITEEEIAKVRSYSSDDTLVLFTGVGAQGGEAELILKYFGKENVIVNVGRDLMFPMGSYSQDYDQRHAAERYRNQLNMLRFQ